MCLSMTRVSGDPVREPSKRVLRRSRRRTTELDRMIMGGAKTPSRPRRREERRNLDGLAEEERSRWQLSDTF